MTTAMKRPGPTALMKLDDVLTPWGLDVPAEHTLEDALHPNYLWTFHDRITPGDIVVFKHELHHFLWVGIVQKVHEDTASIIMTELYRVNLKEAPRTKADLSGAEIKKLCGDEKWSIVNGHIKLKTGFPTKAEAEEWLEEQRTAASAKPAA
jgi:hypothetical protein